MYVRIAEPRDIDYIVDLSRRVQEKLTASGSLQEIGPIPREVVAGQVAAHTACIFDAGQSSQGSVFVEPIDARRRTHWKLGDVARPLWFVHKLMIEPAEQGHGLGNILLDGVRDFLISREPSVMIVLDCWSGNEKLRAFYTQAGFTLHGIFGADGFDVAVFTLPAIAAGS